MSRPRLLALVATLALLGLAPRPAAAQLRTSCGGGGCGGLTLSPELERLLGGYVYAGPASVSGLPGVAFAFGVGHQYLFGLDFDGAVALAGGVVVSTWALRYAPLRLGLSEGWDGPAAPSAGVVFAFRAGANLVTNTGSSSGPPAGQPFLGVDVETVFWGQILLALRTGLVLRSAGFEPGARPDVLPTVSLALGVVASSSYGWSPLGTR